MKQSPPPALRRRYDPQRKQHIIKACLQVISRDGVRNTSHRKVALEAGVPLGSMTYHFQGIDDLLFEAFSQFSQQVSDRFAAEVESAKTIEDLVECLADFIIGDLFSQPHELTINLELYTLAARDEKFRAITDHWMDRTRATLGTRFDPVTAKLMDALIEGLSIHQALMLAQCRTQPTDRALIIEGFSRIILSSRIG